MIILAQNVGSDRSEFSKKAVYASCTPTLAIKNTPLSSYICFFNIKEWRHLIVDMW